MTIESDAQKKKKFKLLVPPTTTPQIHEVDLYLV